MHMMRAAGERAQHALGIRAICWLLKRVAIDLDGCVGAEDEGAGMQRVNRMRFLECEPLHISCGIFGCVSCFVDVSGYHVEGETDLREELFDHDFDKVEYEAEEFDIPLGMLGPDWDFASGAELVKINGKDALVIGNKSSQVFAIDPDTGKNIWRSPMLGRSSRRAAHWR